MSLATGPRQVLKGLHTLGAIGLMGGLLGFGVMAAAAMAASPGGALAIRSGLDLMVRWLVVPSMLVCVVSGFLSMGLHPPFRNALWAGLKGLSGLAVMELTLHLQSQARGATELLGQAPGAAGLAEGLAAIRHTETVLLGALLLLSVGNIVVGVWRPRFRFIKGLPENAGYEGR